MTATAALDAPADHYPADMPARPDDLTQDDLDLIAQTTRAARDLRAAQEVAARANDTLYDIVRAHWQDIERIGWRAFARAVGVDDAGANLISEATLRAWTQDLKRQASRARD